MRFFKIAFFYVQIIHYNNIFSSHLYKSTPWIYDLFLYGIIDLKLSIITNFSGDKIQTYQPMLDYEHFIHELQTLLHEE